VNILADLPLADALAAEQRRLVEAQSKAVAPVPKEPKPTVLPPSDEASGGDPSTLAKAPILSDYESERRADEAGRAFGAHIAEDALEDARLLAIAKGVDFNARLDDRPAFRLKSGEVLPYTTENLAKVLPDALLKPIGRMGTGSHAPPHAPPSLGGSLLEAGLRDFSVFRSNITAIRAERARQKGQGQ
jgi:hypothetical protein